MSCIKQFMKEILYRIRGEYTTEKLVKRGMTVGENFKRLNGVILDPAHCFLISIGNDVTIAPRVHILAHDASTCYELKYAKVGRVDIGNNVFIGAESVVLPNVRIGDNVVIGAGSVVTKNIPSNSVYAGNPAKKIMDYTEYMEKNKVKLRNCPIWDESYTFRNKNLTDAQKQELKDKLKDSIGFLE